MEVLQHSGQERIGISVNEAGRRGGLEVLRRYGRLYFSRIGHLGQQVMRARYPGMASRWGRKGGRPKKPGFSIVMGQGSK